MNKQQENKLDLMRYKGKRNLRPRKDVEELHAEILYQVIR